MDIEIRQLPEMRVATVRHVGPYNQIPQAFERLGQRAAAAGLAAQPGTTMLAIYHDDPETTPQDELRSDAALVVPRDVPLPDGLVEQHIEAGRYACTTHIGPYEQLGDVWARFLGEWLPASNNRIRAGASFEIYRNTPETVPPAQLETELYAPIE